MAYTTINKSSAHFNTKLYTGNASTLNVTGVGFQPDWTWIKSRGGTGSHNLFDAVRGVQKRIFTDLTSAEQTSATYLTAFGSDGFTVGNNGDVNGNNQTTASWNWKANGAGSANTDGSISSTVSVNTTAGFSIVKWSGTSATGTVGHGLGSVPKTVWVKSLANSEGMYSYWQPLGNNKQLLMSSNTGEGTTTLWNNTTPTSSVFSVTNHSAVNGSGDYIAYCFSEKTGYCKIGNYTGNGLTDGTFIYTGFRPSWIMLKRASGDGYEWLIVDDKRDTYNVTTNGLAPNTNSAESGSSYNSLDILSNGFKPRNNETRINNGNGNIIYMAFGQSLVGSNNVPCTAR